LLNAAGARMTRIGRCADVCLLYSMLSLRVVVYKPSRRRVEDSGCRFWVVSASSRLSDAAIHQRSRLRAGCRPRTTVGAELRSPRRGRRTAVSRRTGRSTRKSPLAPLGRFEPVEVTLQRPSAVARGDLRDVRMSYGPAQAPGITAPDEARTR